MKIFAVFFAFYTVVISLAPCCDRFEAANMQQSIQQEHNHHEQGGELCSPFCQCSCCHGFIALHHMRQTSIVPVSAEKQLIYPAQYILPGFSADFWQPPRLG
jgi:hypothetical protein